MTKTHEPIIEGKYKVTEDTRFTPISIEHKKNRFDGRAIRQFLQTQENPRPSRN